MLTTRNIILDFFASLVLIWHWFVGACPTFILVGTAFLVALQLKFYWSKTFGKRNRRASDKEEFDALDSLR